MPGLQREAQPSSAVGGGQAADVSENGTTKRCRAKKLACGSADLLAAAGTLGPDIPSPTPLVHRGIPRGQPFPPVNTRNAEGGTAVTG